MLENHRRVGRGDMDASLTFWYGEFYQPVTPDGKRIYDLFYAGQGGSRLPVSSTEHPIRLRATDR